MGTEGAALLAAVLANPDDDAPRLIMSDWWDEHGQSGRAEFVRVQAALASLPAWVPGRPNEQGVISHGVPNARVEALRRREDELLSAQVGPPGRLNDGSWSWPLWQWLSYWRWRRGFIVAVGCTAESWLEHGDAIVAAAPVEEVTLTTVPPQAWRAETLLRGAWPRVRHWHLPRTVEPSRTHGAPWQAVPLDSWQWG